MTQENFNGQALGFVALILSALAGFVSLRRQPPLDAHFATKKELDAVKAEITRQMTDIRTEITADIRDLFRRIEEVSHDMNVSNERRTESLHQQLKDLAVQVARLKP